MKLRLDYLLIGGGVVLGAYMLLRRSQNGLSAPGARPGTPPAHGGLSAAGYQDFMAATAGSAGPTGVAPISHLQSHRAAFGAYQSPEPLGTGMEQGISAFGAYLSQGRTAPGTGMFYPGDLVVNPAIRAREIARSRVARLS